MVNIQNIIQEERRKKNNEQRFILKGVVPPPTTERRKHTTIVPNGARCPIPLPNTVQITCGNTTKCPFWGGNIQMPILRSVGHIPRQTIYSAMTHRYLRMIGNVLTHRYLRMRRKKNPLGTSGTIPSA